MKKTLFLLMMCLLASVVINAQDLKLEDILKKNSEAIGQDKLSKINTIKMVGKMSMMGMEMQITSLRKRTDKMRMEVNFQGTKMLTTFNGKEGYMINPMMGSSEAQKIGDDQLNQTKNQANMDGNFLNYKEKGNSLELIGTEDINGSKAYKLKLIEKATKDGVAGKTIYYFIDCKNFNLVKSISTENNQGVDIEMEMFYTYKLVDGILMPSVMEAKTGGNSIYTMTFDEIKINEEMPDNLFEKPTN